MFPLDIVIITLDSKNFKKQSFKSRHDALKKTNQIEKYLLKK